MMITSKNKAIYYILFGLLFFAILCLAIMPARAIESVDTETYTYTICLYEGNNSEPSEFYRLSMGELRDIVAKSLTTVDTTTYSDELVLAIVFSQVAKNSGYDDVILFDDQLDEDSRIIYSLNSINGLCFLDGSQVYNAEQAKLMMNYIDETAEYYEFPGIEPDSFVFQKQNEE